MTRRKVRAVDGDTSVPVCEPVSAAYPESAFDRMTALARRAARAPMAMICLSDAGQSFRSQDGLDETDKLQAALFYAEVIGSQEVLWVDDAAADDRFGGAASRLRFHAGAPIVDEAGDRIGAVCVFDATPRPYDSDLAEALVLLAEAAAGALVSRRTLRDLGEARDAANAAARSKSEFLTNMSHEIHTPLNGVLGVAAALGRTALDDSQYEMVALIETSGGTLRALLDDVLDVARIETGQLELSLDSFRLADVLRQSTALFAAAASQKGLALTLGPAPPRLYLGDPTRLRQLIRHLVSNAIKFTEAGEVEVVTEAVPILDGDRVRISVRDTGIGFGPEQQARLFQRFEQADGSLTRRRGGAGLGLALSRGLAEIMGARLEAASSPGRGSTFTLTLDLQHAGEDAARPAALPAAPARVLLAEDNAANRRVVELILGAGDVDLVSVVNGAEAVAAVEAGRFDLVLMDMQMPVMDGLAAIRAIRAYEVEAGAPRTPICMVSAHALPEHVEAAFGAGADSYLAKPVTARALLATVAAALEPGP
jgi:signal transduction histidine kinase/ActR/RegA family two-component response regulator